MKCDGNRWNDEDLERIAAEATVGIKGELMAARDRLTAMLTPAQMEAFNAYDDLLVLEEGLIQDAMARLVCA
jgi:hypothetical protein